MATITVSIGAGGTPSPLEITASAGDTVVFEAASDTVLCVDPASVFGSERYEIAGGNNVALPVFSMPSAGFQYITSVGDLSAECGGSRDKSGGGSGKPGGGGPG